MISILHFLQGVFILAELILLRVSHVLEVPFWLQTVVGALGTNLQRAIALGCLRRRRLFQIASLHQVAAS